MKNQFALALEWIALFLLLPATMAYFRLQRWLYPILLTAFLIVFLRLRQDPTFDRQSLWNNRALPALWLQLARRIFLAAVLLTAFLLLARPDALFAFPRRAPGVWALVMLLYPLLSVYPQEVLYRTFFFHRYRPLFPRRWLLVAASAVAFGFAHIILRNWVAVTFCTLGGVILATAYERHRSTLAVTLEHSLYGDFIFTIGLGSYFYHGAVR